jgi:hypothetical protein
MMLILKVVLTVSIMTCIMLLGFVGIIKLDLGSGTFGFLTMFWMWLCLVVPKILFGGEDDNES